MHTEILSAATMIIIVNYRCAFMEVKKGSAAINLSNMVNLVAKIFITVVGLLYMSCRLMPH